VVRQRGLIYVLLLTTLITFLGAADMYNFERPGLSTYWDAIWWTAMIMTTIGSDYWPKTPEGRVMVLVLSVYAFSIFGYITAAFASILVGTEKEKSSISASFFTAILPLIVTSGPSSISVITSPFDSNSIVTF
jgi:voltage-gated potassium channel